MKTFTEDIFRNVYREYENIIIIICIIRNEIYNLLGNYNY